MGKQDHNSRLAGFYKLSLQKKRETLLEQGILDAPDLEALTPRGGLSLEAAENMIENVIGTISLPVGLALNFQVNGRDVLVPMAVEEPSIVAGASYMAKLARDGGGFSASAMEPVMIGQIQLLDVPDLQQASRKILDQKAALLAELSDLDPILRDLGGGPRGLEVRLIDHSAIGPFLVVHLLMDVRDAMGANAVNTACEKLAPHLEGLSGGRVRLRILSNLADHRLAHASCLIPVSSLAGGEFSGEEVRDGVIEAWAFADADPYRAATHNKGIMNGIDAVLLATGNDWRAVEAGAHAYAARYGYYRSLSTWSKDRQGNLRGEVELPLAAGVVGGATRVNPGARAALKLMEVQSAGELAAILAAVGLAQNLAALRALATEGIQQGHMRLHARQVAMAAGAEGEQIELVVERLIKENMVRIDRADAILRELTRSGKKRVGK
jgi:hydroxymethylglutaryl-CoA reductase